MEKNNVVFCKVLINAESFSKLNSISLEECNEALILLNCLLKRNISNSNRKEINHYLTCINLRITELNHHETKPAPVVFPFKSDAAESAPMA